MITEQWIHGCLVERIMFRDGLVLNLDDYYNELVFAVPFRGEVRVVRHDLTGAGG